MWRSRLGYSHYSLLASCWYKAVLLSKETCFTCVFPEIRINSSPLLKFSYSLTVVLYSHGLVFTSVILPFVHTHLSKWATQRPPQHQLSILWVHSPLFLTRLGSSSPSIPSISEPKPISPAAECPHGRRSAALRRPPAETWRALVRC